MFRLRVRQDIKGARATTDEENAGMGMEIENISASGDLTSSSAGKGLRPQGNWVGGRALLRSKLGRAGDRFGDSSDMSKKVKG